MLNGTISHLFEIWHALRYKLPCPSPQEGGSRNTQNMKIQNSRATLLAAGLGLVIGTGQAYAVTQNITIDDPNAFGESTNSSSWYKGALAGGTVQSHEYKEVEPSMTTGAQWDLVAMVADHTVLTNQKLGILSSYDLKNGTSNPDTPTTIGDIFVSTAPGSVNSYSDNPNYNYVQYAKNGTLPFNYNFVLKMNFTLNNYSVIQVDSNTVFENAMYYNTPQNYNAASNPWRLASTTGGLVGGNLGTVIGTFGMTYTSTLLNATADSLAGFDVDSTVKHYAELQHMEWLKPYLDVNNPESLFHLTMQCGNDNMWAIDSAGFRNVPDNAVTLILLGAATVAMTGFRRFNKK